MLGTGMEQVQRLRAASSAAIVLHGSSISWRTCDREHRVQPIRCAAAADARHQHERCARECPPLRRDAAPAEGDRAPLVRAGGDQQHPAGHGGGAQFPGHRRSGRRQAARAVQHGRHRLRWRDEKTDLVHQLYVYEHGQRLSLPPSKYNPESKLVQALLKGAPVLFRNQAELDALGVKTTREPTPACHASSCPYSSVTG